MQAKDWLKIHLFIIGINIAILSSMGLCNSKTLVILAVLSSWVCVSDTSYADNETQIRSIQDANDAYQKVRAEIEAYRSEDHSGLLPLLNRVWLITAAVASLYLQNSPYPTSKELVKEIESLDPPKECGEYDHDCFEEYHLNADVLCLQTGENAAYVIAVGYPRFGTFYIVARSAGGLFKLVWNIKEIAAKHYPLRDELGYWAYIGFPYNDGPLKVRSVRTVPKLRNGNSRFLIDAFAARYAGGTGPSQLSIWEWDGSVAKPQLIKTYMTSSATPGSMKFNGEYIKIPTKEEFKTFFSCGMCEDPVGEWTIRITKDGIEDLGHKHLVPELQIIDELFDRLIQQKPIEDIASARVSARLKKEFQELSKSSTKGHISVGMLGEWKVRHTFNGSEICLATDEVQALIYTVVSRHKKEFISDITEIDNYCSEYF